MVNFKREELQKNEKSHRIDDFFYRFFSFFEKNFHCENADPNYTLFYKMLIFLQKWSTEL